MDPAQQDGLSGLFDEVVALYHGLTRSAALIHGRGPLSGPRRTVLITLQRMGPQTVSGLARTRHESRQRLQPLVNTLLAGGLVEASANPLHKKAPLIALTRKGQRTVEAIVKREAMLRSGLRFDVSAARIRNAATLIATVRAGLERQLPDLVKRRK